MGVGKLIVVVGIVCMVARPLGTAIGWSLPSVLNWVGIAIIIIGALVHILERK